MADKIPEEVKGLSIGLHVVSILVTLMRVTDPMPEKMNDALIELNYSPRQPSKTLVQGFPFKDNLFLSMVEIENLVGLFSSIKSVNQEIEKVISKISV